MGIGLEQEPDLDPEAEPEPGVEGALNEGGFESVLERMELSDIAGGRE